MAYEQFRIYGYNHGNEPEHYRLHVHDQRTDYDTPNHAHHYDTYQSSITNDYIDRPHQSRPEDHIEPYMGSSRRSRRKPTDYSTEDYISPPTANREDYIDQAYDETTRERFHHTSRHRRVPGGFYEEDEDSPSLPNISTKEQQTIHRLMKEAKFGNEHEIMRAYWVPQEYDEMPVDRDHPPKEGSRLKLEPKRVRYDSESDTDVQTYVDDSVDDDGDEVGIGRGSRWDGDEDGAFGARDRWRSTSRRIESAQWDRSPRMPGGYASSSPSIQYESDEEHTRHRTRKMSKERVVRRHAPSSPDYKHKDSSASPVAQRYASSSSPVRSDWSRHQSPVRRRRVSFSPSTDYSRHRSSSNSPARRHASFSPRPRLQRAPSPPPAIARHYSSSSPSVHVDSDYEVPVRYDSDTEGDEDTCVSGSVRGRYVGSDLDSDICSDFVINGGSDCDFEGDDIWNDSGSEDDEYDED